MGTEKEKRSDISHIRYSEIDNIAIQNFNIDIKIYDIKIKNEINIMKN